MLRLELPLAFAVRAIWRRLVGALRLKDSGIRTMATARAVATYILKEHGSMTAMKLQKLVYYCQAWHLVRSDTVLYPDKIQAWAAGPVVRSLFALHRGRYTLSAGDLSDGSELELTDDEKATIDRVVKNYGHLSASELSDLTHSEPPWIEAREGLEPTERGESEIDPSAMAEYFVALAQSRREN